MTYRWWNCPLCPREMRVRFLEPDQLAHHLCSAHGTFRRVHIGETGSHLCCCGWSGSLFDAGQHLRQIRKKKCGGIAAHLAAGALRQSAESLRTA